MLHLEESHPPFGDGMTEINRTKRISMLIPCWVITMEMRTLTPTPRNRNGEFDHSLWTVLGGVEGNATGRRCYSTDLA